MLMHVYAFGWSQNAAYLWCGKWALSNAHYKLHISIVHVHVLLYFCVYCAKYYLCFLFTTSNSLPICTTHSILNVHFMFRSVCCDLHFIILKLYVLVSFIDVSVCREENTLQDFRCRVTVDISILTKGMLLVRFYFVVLFQTQSARTLWNANDSNVYT